jgi:type I restriction enzyme S subunit
MSLPRYPAYKDSGVEWLGEVPVGWTLHRFRHLFKESAEKIEGEVVGPMLSVSGYRGIEVKEYDDENRRRSADESVGYRIVRVGQLVVNTMWLNYGGLGVSAHEGHVSPAYRAYWISPDLERGFVHYLLRSGLYVQGYTRLLTGVRPNSLQMSRDDLMDFPVLVPTRDEQHAIADFLDRETAKIDALVAEQQRLIELLKEKRQAVISHAVTKGLNPDAPMKDSGVEWLGEVPEHWSNPTLNSRYSTELGKMLDEKRVSGMHLVPYLRNVDVQWDAINLESLPEMDIGEAEHERYTIRSGDILVCEGGEVGRAAIVGAVAGTYGFQKALHRLRPRDASCESVRYLFYTFAWAALTGVFQTGGMSTIAHLTGEQLRRYRFPRPPLAEQVAIAAFLDRETVALKLLTAEAQRAIDLLQERRTALISAAVTGRIDVRPADERASA